MQLDESITSYKDSIDPVHLPCTHGFGGLGTQLCNLIAQKMPRGKGGRHKAAARNIWKMGTIKAFSPVPSLKSLEQCQARRERGRGQGCSNTSTLSPSSSFSPEAHIPIIATTQVSHSPESATAIPPRPFRYPHRTWDREEEWNSAEERETASFDPPPSFLAHQRCTQRNPVPCAVAEAEINFQNWRQEIHVSHRGEFFEGLTTSISSECATAKRFALRR